ncbi:MAG: hypothetical protein NUV76_12245 [Candidatus Kuenenia sp.]|nr:hypothetical protein [Candidatus Kuenenia sp.]
MAIARTHKNITDAAIKADEELKALLNATEEEATPEVTPAIPAVKVEEKVIENANAEPDAIKKAEAKPEVKPIEEKKEVANNEDAIWHERYKEINGKYLSEVPRFAADKRELKKDVARLEEQVRVLTEQLAAKDNGKESYSQESYSQDVKINKLSDTFGEEGAQSINAYLDERVKEVERKFESKLKPVEIGIETIKTGQAVTAKQRYAEGLDNLVPKWKQYDRDPAFGKWLDENFLQYTGQSFRQILTEADANMNVPTIAKIIFDYEKATITPQKNASDDRKQNELEKQLAPAKTGGSGRIPKGNEGEAYSKKAIDKFYNDWQSQKLKMSIADRTRMDEIYTKAIIEGRLAP